MDSKKIDTTNLPDLPGVYFFRRGAEILYIGKAASLKSRVRSYFDPNIAEERGPKITQMVAIADSVDFQTTDSALEALILESKLIKKYQPVYNTKEKDDKTFYHVAITEEDFPRVILVRGKDIKVGLPFKIKKVFGPFPKGVEIREGLKIIRKIFPYHEKCELNQGKRCFDAQIGLCPGICIGTISKKDYLRNIKSIIFIFEGKKVSGIKSLAKEMHEMSRMEKFEEAAKIRNQIFALNHIKDVSLIKKDTPAAGGRYRIEAFDVAHIRGKSSVGSMAVFIGGEADKTQYRRFKLAQNHNGNDVAALEEILLRRFNHRDWPEPDVVVIDGGLPQKNTAEKVLAEYRRLNLPENKDIFVVAVTKDDKHKAQNILGGSAIIKDHHSEIIAANLEAHRFAVAYHRKLRETF